MANILYVHIKTVEENGSIIMSAKTRKDPLEPHTFFQDENGSYKEFSFEFSLHFIFFFFKQETHITFITKSE